MDLMDINEVSPHVLRRYVAAGDKIKAEVSTIFNLTRQLDLSGTDKTGLDPLILKHINQVLSTKLFNIWAILDDFIYLIQTQQDKAKAIPPVADPVQKDHRLNPLLEEGCDGVIPRVICIMEYLSGMALQEGLSMNENMHYGRWQIDETMINALKHVEDVTSKKQHDAE